MVRPIMKDVLFLNQKAELATQADRQTGSFGFTGYLEST